MSNDIIKKRDINVTASTIIPVEDEPKYLDVMRE